MRKNLTKKQLLPKKSSRNIKVWHDDEGTPPKGYDRREQKMSTVFKKSKDFIERIDPTNSIYSKTEKGKDESHHGRGQRGSVCFQDRFSAN